MKKRVIILSTILLILIALVIMTGLPRLSGGGSSSYQRMRMKSPSSTTSLQNVPNRKLIKTGDLEFECDSLDETRTLVEQAVKETKSYISDERLNAYEYRKTLHLEIRVPVEHFDVLVAAISKGASKITSKSISIEDVTERYLDIETRLAVKHQLEARYRELLAQANEVKDLLAIEEQIGTLRADIESAEGQIKRLDDQIALSTLDVSFTEKLEESPTDFAHHFQNGIGNGRDNLMWFLIGLVNIWPFILIIGVIIGCVIYRKKSGPKHP